MRRAAAYERFAAGELPTEAEEVWRYSRISELDLDAFAPVSDAEAAPAAAVPSSLQPLLDAVGERAGLVLTVDGRLASVEVDPALAAKGVAVGSLADLPEGDALLGTVSGPNDVFGNLHAAFLRDPVAVHVPAGVVVDRPVVVLHWVGRQGAAVFPRTIVVAEDGSEVTVVDVAASEDVRALVVPTWELDAQHAANLRYLNVQLLGPRVWQIGYQASRAARDATLQSAMVALGGDYARVRADAKLTGEGGTSHLLAVYFGDRTQMHDFRTMQDHDAPRTTSDLLFKGAVEDTARSVYTGLIRVKHGAAGTRALQTNRNLVLSEGASANSVPNLEIEENDVSCSHASAVGPIDEEQRYYLEARGIPTEVAERLIVLGFFDDVLERVPVPGLHAFLRAAVEAKLK